MTWFVSADGELLNERYIAGIYRAMTGEDKGKTMASMNWPIKEVDPPTDIVLAASLEEIKAALQTGTHVIGAAGDVA